MAMKRRRFSLGGSWAAASTISGMPLARHTAATVGRSTMLLALAEKPTATTDGDSAASISQASSPRTPAPVPRSLWPISTSRAPDAASAWA